MPTLATNDLEQLCLGIPRVAEALDCSVTTVRRLVERGDLPSIRLGARVVVPVSALHAFIANGGSGMEER